MLGYAITNERRARLIPGAAAGEILVTEATTRVAGVAADARERRHLDLRGRSEATDVLVLRASGEGDAIVPAPR